MGAEELPADGLALLDQMDQRVFRGEVDSVLPAYAETILPGSFVARLEGASGGESGGLEGTVLDGFHTLVGIVDPEEGR